MMYVRYTLSLRNVEDLLFAAEIRKKRVDAMWAHTHWQWHLDEVYVKINGKMHYLWRAVDHEGEVLESSLQATR